MTVQIEIEDIDLEALAEACRYWHENKSRGAGGASFCHCGASGGGSAACNVLGQLQSALMRAQCAVVFNKPVK